MDNLGFGFGFGVAEMDFSVLSNSLIRLKRKVDYAFASFSEQIEFRIRWTGLDRLEGLSRQKNSLMLFLIGELDLHWKTMFGSRSAWYKRIAFDSHHVVSFLSDVKQNKH